MPKETFDRLAPKKKKRIVDAFLLEFAAHAYEEASITTVVKKLKIAKGSIYQYFENKLELFIYLVTSSNQKKQVFVESINRKDFSDFWAYLKTLYIAGNDFEKAHPLESKFLISIEKNTYSPALSELYATWRHVVIGEYTSIIKQEITKGLFRSDLPADKMAFMLYKLLLSINDYVRYHPGDTTDQDQLIAAVDDYILILKPAFDIPTS